MTIYKLKKGSNLSFPKKSNLGITKNHRGITAIVAKFYNALLLNRIRPEVEKVLRKNQISEKSILKFTDSDYPSNH